MHPPHKKRRLKPFLLATCAVTIAALAAGAFFLPGILNPEDTLSYHHIEGNRESPNKLLVVRVDGIIVGTDQEAGPLKLINSTTSGYAIQKKLDQAAKDEAIKGVIFRMSTPGGTVHGSRAIFDAIKEFRETTKKPVIGHVEGITASGGIYAIVGASEIYAEPGSLTGSIGVTLGNLIYYDSPMARDQGLFGEAVETKNGIRSYSLTAGTGKDFFNPYREPTPDELANVQKGLDSEYRDFVRHVATARGIDPETIVNEMGAYLFFNEQAAQFKLIDGVKTRRETVRHLVKTLDLGSDYELVEADLNGSSLIGSLLARVTYPTPTTSSSQAALCAMPVPGVLAYHGNLAGLCR